MTENDLREMISSWDHLTIAIPYLTEHPQHFDMLMNVSMDDNLKDSWRASWIADKVHEKYPELLEPYLEPIIDFLQQTSNSSKKRQFLKLLSLHPMPENKAGIMLDYCIRQFTSGSEPIAVRVYAMQVLYNISNAEPDLKSELIQLIEHEMEYHSSAGIKSRGQKLVRNLKKQITGNHYR